MARRHKHVWQLFGYSIEQLYRSKVSWVLVVMWKCARCTDRTSVKRIVSPSGMRAYQSLRHVPPGTPAADAMDALFGVRP